MFKKIILGMSLLSMASCGTILSGTEQNMIISAYENGNEVRDASCQVSDSKQTINVKTPRNLSIDKSKRDLSITCEKDGVKSDTAIVESSFNTISIVGIFIDLGLITMTTDFISGAAWKYPERVEITFPPQNKSTNNQQNIKK